MLCFWYYVWYQLGFFFPCISIFQDWCSYLISWNDDMWKILRAVMWFRLMKRYAIKFYYPDEILDFHTRRIRIWILVNCNFDIVFKQAMWQLNWEWREYESTIQSIQLLVVWDLWLSLINVLGSIASFCVWFPSVSSSLFASICFRD